MRVWKLFLIISILACSIPAGAAYLENIPQTVIQPDGKVLTCFSTGDEYYNWLHDSDGYVIIQDHNTGYYTYAVSSAGDLVPSQYIAGSVNPESVGLQKNLRISPELLQKKILSSPLNMRASEGPPQPAPKTGTINNIVIFIRFSDEAEFTDLVSTYNNSFNNATAGQSSMHNYFKEASYNQLTITTTMYPIPGGTTVVSYQDSHPRAYFQPYDATTNPAGYQESERTSREHTLLKAAVDAVSSQVPTSLNLDGDNDGRVDNVCFIVKGGTTAWSTLLWPHMWSLYSQSAYINGKRVYTYNFQLQSAFGVSVLCHEMSHSLGAPDLYHYTSNGINPVGRWDIMESNRTPPQHSCAYMKWKYLKWIPTIPEITQSGTYTLNPVTSPTGNCYKIKSPNSTTEFFVVEYRRNTGTFEVSLPGSGLLIYRINSTRTGNSNGPPDEVYVYRPGGTSPTVNGTVNSANYSSNVGRTAINETTSPTPFLTDGSPGGLRISNIGAAGETISFTVDIPGEKVATPILNPANGTFPGVFDVQVSCPTAGATIRYTINGADPTDSDPVVSGPITVDHTMTIKARAFKDYMTASDVASGSYIVTGYCTTGGFIKGGRWNLVSVPADPANPDPLVVFSGINVPFANLQYWKNDQDGGGYQSYGNLFGWTGPVVRGSAYWLMEPSETQNKDITIQAQWPGSEFILNIPARQSAPFWILFGTPFPKPVSTDSIRFRNVSRRGDTWLTWEEAFSQTDAGLRIVDSNAQVWDAATSQLITVTPSVWAGYHSFDPWKGYWLLVYDSAALQIQFPRP